MKERICKIEGCDEPCYSKNAYCHKHYRERFNEQRRQLKSGERVSRLSKASGDKTCCNEGCNNPVESGRLYCRSCYLNRRKELYYQKKENGVKYRTEYSHVCEACGNVYANFNKRVGRLCNNCKKKMSRGALASDSYEYTTESYKSGVLHEHRRIAQEKIGRKLGTDEVVHHLNCDPSDNSVSNLVVLNRKDHGSLHHFLEVERVIYESSNQSVLWKNVVVSKSREWFEKNSVKLIFLSENRPIGISDKN